MTSLFNWPVTNWRLCTAETVAYFLHYC